MYELVEIAESRLAGHSQFADKSSWRCNLRRVSVADHVW
jgi:hypothetical protein